MDRRDFLTTAGVAAGSAAVPGVASAALGAATPMTADGEVMTALTVNGQIHQLSVEPRTTLLEVLREQLQLTGTKKGCDRGVGIRCSYRIGLGPGWPG